MKKTPIRLYCTGKKYTLKMFLIAIFQFRLYYDASLHTISCTTNNTCCHTEFRPVKHLILLPLTQATRSRKRCCSWMLVKSMCKHFILLLSVSGQPLPKVEMAHFRNENLRYFFSIIPTAFIIFDFSQQ